ncbi:MAG: hypothetical protein IJ007_07380 [Oscillospiraceae bacterium]|nr:hypothetical protein [Oscillospiraceae bacterium]
MRCIPRGLLIHKAEIRTVLNEDCFGGRELSEPEKLRFIRIDRENSDEKAGHAFKCTGSAVLIYDAVSSLPGNFEFAVGQEVLSDGTLYRIRLVRKLYDKRKLHHIEAELTEIQEGLL